MVGKRKQQPLASEKQQIGFFFRDTESKKNGKSEDFLRKRLRDEKNSLPTSHLEENVVEKRCECKENVEKIGLELEELKKKYLLLEEKNRSLVSDCRTLKKLLNESTKINLQKDIQIQKISSEKYSDSSNEGLFVQFQGKFSEDTLKKLRSLGVNAGADSGFILKCVEFLYGDDLEKLKNRTASIPTNSKTPFTPEKQKIITEIYKERLLNLNISATEYNYRSSKRNDHVKNAINNLTRNKRKRVTEKSDSINGQNL